MADTPLQLDPTLISLFNGQGFIVPKGSNVGASLFSFSKFSPNVTVETVEKTCYDAPVPYVAKKKVRKATVEIEIALDSISEFALRAAAMSADSDGYVVQSAKNDVAFTIAAADAKAGGVYQIYDADTGNAIQNITEVSATWGKAAGDVDVVPVDGEHYTVHPRSGVVQILKRPASIVTDGDFVLTYSANAITAAEKLTIANFASAGAGQRCEIHFVGVNEDDVVLRGDWYDVEFTPNGAQELQSQNDFASVTLKGTAYPVSTFRGRTVPSREKFGKLTKLSTAEIA